MLHKYEAIEKFYVLNLKDILLSSYAHSMPHAIVLEYTNPRCGLCAHGDGREIRYGHEITKAPLFIRYTFGARHYPVIVIRYYY